MKLFLLVSFCCVFQQNVLSQSNSLVRSTTGAAGASTTVVNGISTYIVQQSIGQSSVIGTTYNDSYVLRQGFIQPDILSKIINKSIPLNLHLEVYPNPFDKQISLSFSEVINSEINIEVFDVLGRKIFKKGLQKSQQTAVVLDMLPSGEYILKIIANKKQFVTKILKR